jgi:hypothetical protein
MAYVGTPIDTRNQFQSLQGKRFSGDGSTTAFTLDVAPSSTLDIEVFVGNVRQRHFIWNNTIVYWCSS